MKKPNIVPLLKKAYEAELETVQNYLANSVWLDGLRAHEVAEALAADIPEELGHAQKLAQRLKQLGVCPLGSLELARNQKFIQPSPDSTNLRHVVEGALAAERVAIVTYQEIFAACEGMDPVTQDLAVKILADEEGHRTLFEGFLKSLDKDADKMNARSSSSKRDILQVHPATGQILSPVKGNERGTKPKQQKSGVTVAPAPNRQYEPDVRTSRRGR